MCKWHRPRIKPSIQNIRHSFAFSSAIAFKNNFINNIFMQIINFYSAGFFKFCGRCKNKFFFTFFTSPNRNCICPKTLTRNRPVAGAQQAIAQTFLLLYAQATNLFFLQFLIMLVLFFQQPQTTNL